MTYLSTPHHGLAYATYSTIRHCAGGLVHFWIATGRRSTHPFVMSLGRQGERVLIDVALSLQSRHENISLLDVFSSLDAANTRRVFEAIEMMRIGLSSTPLLAVAQPEVF